MSRRQYESMREHHINKAIILETRIGDQEKKRETNRNVTSC